jgi:serine/threonine kinase PknH
LILGVAVVVVAALAGTGIWLARDNTGGEAPGTQSTTSATSSTTAITPTGSTSAAPTVVATQLDSILLSPAQINGIVGTSGIVVNHDART